MSNANIILELLDEIQPKKYCDDCLSSELKMEPRQQVNQICRGLETQRKLIRQKGVCDSCNKRNKITNLIGLGASVMPSTKVLRESPTVYMGVSPKAELDIEKIRTQVVRICRQVWSDKKSEAPPHSISVVINSLRNENLLPSHQANMMLTLCNLRNAYVYENMELGSRETTIASTAWEIVSDWWSKLPK
jgi:hypothetical protein